MEKTKTFEQRLESIFGPINEEDGDHAAKSANIEDHWDFFESSTNLDHPKVLPVQVANMRFAFLSGAFATSKIQQSLALLDTEDEFIEGSRVANEIIARALVAQVTALETALKSFLADKSDKETQGTLQ